MLRRGILSHVYWTLCGCVGEEQWEHCEDRGDQTAEEDREEDEGVGIRSWGGEERKGETDRAARQEQQEEHRTQETDWGTG